MMLHLLMEKGPWFRAKRTGYGAGLPFKWQGWAVVTLYVTALADIGILSKQNAAFQRAGALTPLLIISIIFFGIVIKRTEGGWKWRWGDSA